MKNHSAYLSRRTRDTHQACPSRRAIGTTAVGADALIIEVHNNPSKALCDGVQNQTPEMFTSMMKKIGAIKPHAWERG